MRRDNKTSIRDSFFRRIPDFKGKRRIARSCYRSVINAGGPLTIRAAGGLKFVLPNLIENVAFELFINGYYEKSLVDYLVDNLPRNGKFYDVGANIGAISLFVAKRRPDVMVHSFEASPRVFKYLAENIAANNVLNVQAYNRAVDVADEEQRSFYSPEDKFGKGSFSPVFTGEAEEVRTVRLDSFIKSAGAPDLIKIDVEGFEKNIFQSMENYLNTTASKPDIIFEFVDWAEKIALGTPGAAQQYIREFGYKLYDFDKLTRGKQEELPVIENGMLNIIAKAAQE